MLNRLLVKKIVNNNIVIAENFRGQEVVAIGNGLGFRKKKYDSIDPKETSKTYVLVDNAIKEQLLTLIYEVPYEVIEVTHRIIDMAQKELNATFNVNLVIALADHINFSITQLEQGLSLPTLVDEEVKRFYKNEYQIGVQAIEMINQSLGVSLRKEEASSIAFHLITATEKKGNHDALKIMTGVKEIVGIVEETLNMRLGEEDMAYSRFVIHLKFFVRSILFEQAKEADSTIGSFLSQFEEGYDEAKLCVNKISKYVLEKYEYQTTSEEQLYLLIHIVRLMNQK